LWWGRRYQIAAIGYQVAKRKLRAEFAQNAEVAEKREDYRRGGNGFEKVDRMSPPFAKYAKGGVPSGLKRCHDPSAAKRQKAPLLRSG